MALGANVSSDAAAFRASVERAKTRDINRAIVVALNRTADRVRAEASRRIRGEYGVQARELRRAFTIRRAWQGNLESMVYGSGRPLNVGAFGARQTRKGVSVAIKGGVRKIIPGAFFMRITNNGYRGVFERRFLNGRDGKRHGRFPVRSVTTVSVPGLFRQEIVKKSLADVAVDAFRTELTRAVRVALKEI